MSDVTLSASIRTNLLTIQDHTAKTDRATLRLSTGKEVNAAVDGPSVYFQAKSLTNRAHDLMATKDPIDQSLSAIGAANAGIDAITSLVEQMRAVVLGGVRDAGISRDEIAAQFDLLRQQLDGIAADATYNGVNLLSGSPTALEVPLDPDTGSTLTITGASSDAASLGIGDSATGYNGFATDADLAAAVDDLGSSINTLRSTASQIGVNASVLSTRLDFTESMTNTLKEGAASLTDADLNEEAANLLALSIARQLSTEGLRMANQSQQAILNLF